MNTPRSTLLWLAGLAAAAGLFVYSRTKKGELVAIDAAEGASEALDEIVVTAQKIPGQVVEFAAKLFPAEVANYLGIRGIRNNNPGNVEQRDPWVGLVPANQRTDDRFAEFVKPEYGIRVIAYLLKGYSRKDDGPSTVGSSYIDTVREVIARWAPANENDTEAYARAVAAQIGVTPDAVINLQDPGMLQRVTRAIIRHENGVDPYSNETINAGIALA